MSTSYNTYVGPYIKVLNPMLPIVREHHSCPNTNCVCHGETIGEGFCPKCGSRIERVNRVQLEKIKFNCLHEFGSYIWEIMSYEEQKPLNKEYWHYFISKASGTHLNGKYPSETPIMVNRREEELRAFEKLNKKEINRLEQVFGVGNVIISWGVLKWTS